MDNGQSDNVVFFCQDYWVNRTRVEEVVGIQHFSAMVMQFFSNMKVRPLSKTCYLLMSYIK